MKDYFLRDGEKLKKFEKKGKNPPVMITTVSVEIDLAREIYERLLSQGWRKTDEVWLKK